MDTKRTERELLLDIANRTRRMETRLVRFSEAQGLQFNTLKPLWDDGSVIIPNINCSIADILEAIPKDVPEYEEIEVIYSGKFLLAFFRNEG